MNADDDDGSARLKLGPDVLVVNNRYEAMSIANDVLIGVFFLAGSIMFFSESLRVPATTMFLLGSIDFVLRPIIRLARRMHLRRIGHSGEVNDY